MKRNDLSFRIVETDSDKMLAKEIVENYHSYVPTYRSVGRRLDWLIFYEGALVGMIGIGSSTYPPCKDILRRLKINKEQYKKIFNSFANNFLIIFDNRYIFEKSNEDKFSCWFNDIIQFVVLILSIVKLAKGF